MEEVEEDKDISISPQQNKLVDKIQKAQAKQKGKKKYTSQAPNETSESMQYKKRKQANLEEKGNQKKKKQAPLDSESTKVVIDLTQEHIIDLTEDQLDNQMSTTI